MEELRNHEYRSQLPLPDSVTSELSLLHRIASSLELSTTPAAAAVAAAAAVDQQEVSRSVRQLARLVTGCPTEQLEALVKLAHAVNESSCNCYALAAAGGIPFIVELLGSSSMDVLDLAAGMLGTMAYASAALQKEVAAAGGVEKLRQLLGGQHPAVLRLQQQQQHQQHGGGGAGGSSAAALAAMQQLEASFGQCHC
ncbi:hypothetical protein OEZ86_010275 [Tetradesmus obliquus]|nr:hypothetical protein OEZ86_010275 [Tetradesmus obliquus]